MKNPILQLTLLIITFGLSSEKLMAQARWPGAELFNAMHEHGYREKDSFKFHKITFRRWEGDRSLTTASMYLIGGISVHFPNADLLDELKRRGMREAQQWIAIDTVRWNLSEKQQGLLLLAAELQMRATLRQVNSSLQCLNDLDLESQDSRATLQSAEFAIADALHPRFRARECLYYQMLMKMKK